MMIKRMRRKALTHATSNVRGVCGI